MEELKVRCTGCEKESVVNGSGECTACGTALAITNVVKRIDDYCNEFSLITTEDKVSRKNLILLSRCAFISN